MSRPEVLVLGATGRVGGGIVAGLLEAGSPVLAVGRDSARLQALAERHGQASALTVMAGSVASEAAAAALAAQVADRPRPLAAVVACLGGAPVRGRLLDRPATALVRRMQQDLAPHLTAARHLLPLLADLGGRYLLVGGPCGLRPWRGHGDLSVASAATRMLAHVLHEEAEPFGVRVQLLSVDALVCDPARGQERCTGWIEPIAVGRAVVPLLAGRGVNGRVVVDLQRAQASIPVHGVLAGVSLPLSTSLQEVSR